MESRYVTRDPSTRSGAPCVAGRRITVLHLVTSVRSAGFERYLLLDEYGLSRDGLLEVLQWCGARSCEVGQPSGYCWGCSLHAKYAGMTFEEACQEHSWLEEEDRQEWEGVEGWRIAAEVLADARLGATPWSGPEVDSAVLAQDRPPDVRAGLESLDDRIEVNEAVLAGKPVVTGTRLTVEFLLDLMDRGWTDEQILDNYPGLVVDDLRAWRRYRGSPM
jgi:uncharacterized protein (DUF433 family)